MSTPTLVPDRRRQRFPRNGGPRPTQVEREEAQVGIAAARRALEAVMATGPAEPTVVRRLTPEQTRRARLGLAAARAALATPPLLDDTEARSG